MKSGKVGSLAEREVLGPVAMTSFESVAGSRQLMFSRPGSLLA